MVRMAGHCRLLLRLHFRLVLQMVEYMLVGKKVVLLVVLWAGEMVRLVQVLAMAAVVHLEYT